MNRTTQLLLPMTLALVSAVPARAQNDQVLVRGGSAVSGKVVAVTPVEITVNVAGSQRKVKVNEVRRVMFAGEPSELNSGRGKVLAGKFDSAYRDLKRVDPNSVSQEIIKRDLQFYLAFCEGKLALTAGGDKAKATESMLAFVNAVPRSHHFFEAAELLGDLAVARGDFEGAVKYYGAITKSPFPTYQVRSLIAQGRARVAQQDFAEALQSFDAALAVNSNTAEAKRQKQLALVGRGRCLAETSSPDEGIAVIEQVIADNDASDGELFGRAYNALGDCLLKANQPKDALMAYLHVDLLFYSNPDIHAESLYHLTRLWSMAKQTDRAATAKNLLNERYPGSIWANQQ